MSFQGDVGGIGLADLLQSLARGREGVLTLVGSSGKRSTLGVQGGLLYLLPGPEEDPETWRNRATRAWIDRDEQRVDSLRMSEIARAVRLERVYALLDADEVHFRFAPGPLPDRPRPSSESQAREGRSDAVHCSGMPIESMLLEYARLSDEIESERAWLVQTDDVVPTLLDARLGQEGEGARFFRECDGTSNLVEIGDRLGWTQRQTRLVTSQELRLGRLRLAEPHELLDLAHQELSRSAYTRAASRLTGWVNMTPPGPPSDQDVDVLAAAWKGGHLQPALRAMPRATARTLLRRMDLSLQNPLVAVEHWSEYARLWPKDPLAELRLLACQHRDQSDPNLPALRDLLGMARVWREDDHPQRAACLLRIAAERDLPNLRDQLEVGLGMIEGGLLEDGEPWLLSVARTYMDRGLPDKAVPPLKRLLESGSKSRDARRLLTRARNVAVRRRLVRKNTLVALAIVVALSLGAAVQVRMDMERERRLNEVTLLLDRPSEALLVLDRYFVEDESPRVAALREQIEARRANEESYLRQAWIDRFREAQIECNVGDPVLGLRRAMELPPPPRLGNPDERWPLATDLYDGLAARLERGVTEKGEEVVDEAAQVHHEQRLASLVEEVLAVCEENARAKELQPLAERLRAVDERLDARGEARAKARSESLRESNLARQDLLLATARAHAEAGDLQRSLDAYEALIDTDTTGKLEPLLRKEIEKIQKRHVGVHEARRLASAGEHDRAIEVLEASVDNPRDYLLPWRMESFPVGARARLRDGSVRVTPFVVESAIDEPVALTLEVEGYEPTELEIDAPGDQLVFLSRRPERHWRAEGRVECLPVAVGDDHVVADRKGSLVRLSGVESFAWERQLSSVSSLGGVARTPVFLPKKPGFLLTLTEDGDAWIVDGASGDLEGPYSVGAPPVEGPLSTQQGVRATFADGTVATWDTRLRPEVRNSSTRGAGTDDLDALYGSTAGLAVLRRRQASGQHLACPWTDLEIEVAADVFRVRDRTSGELRFVVGRSGEFEYVAWEAPHAKIPAGRLWISDGAGLRSFRP